MADSGEKNIPARLQPELGAVGFDLEQALSGIVNIRSSIPADALTADTLGTERNGAGVIIRESGLVLTIGYLIIEAETVWLSSSRGNAVPGDVIAFDAETGFGLVQALGKLGAPALELGRASELAIEDPVIISASADAQNALRSRLVARQEFAGYWEYLLPEALFLAPAHPLWGGAAILNSSGKLVGIGSLHMQQASESGTRRDVNMAVPIDLLPPILDDLLTYGRRNKPPRPWLGLYCAEAEQGLMVAGVINNSPAHSADLREGDSIISVDGVKIVDLAGLWRQIWRAGEAGVEIAIRVARDGEVRTAHVKTVDRASFLKPHLLH